ncbi:hypothetical protein ES332_D08G096400v1 [Gossypium tomentosum]|uniref:PRLI-interacting factor A n=1 Tax=Gossypium tomentosum TaxID=34277 RepID=A0A5D2JSS7_GOSTO|nr:hypothetical protein ES332_D08G096400v1 [Gossypium tomentosum]
MNDQSQMINQPPQMMMDPIQSQMMNQSHQLAAAAAAAAHSQARSQLGAVLSQPMSSGHQMMNQPPPTLLNRSYMPWQSQDPNPNPSKKFPSFSRNNNWKGKKAFTHGSVSTASGSNTQGYKPPTLNELQSLNQLKARKFYGNKKKFNNKSNNRFAPYAPRNTTSFIIRAKRSGGVASLVSPCPVTPAVLPTPIFSPSREVLGDMAKEEWGVDGYGSMKGLIRLRTLEAGDDDEEDEDVGDGGGSSESDVEEHVEVERRLDHDLSRFEMIYPSYGGDYNNVLENRVDDQDTHIAQLEEENLTLKEKLFLMERELRDLTRRLQFLERRSQVVEYANEEVVENGSDNESEDAGSDFRMRAASAYHNNVEMAVFAAGNSRDVGTVVEDDNNNNNNSGLSRNEGPDDVSMDRIAEDNIKNEGKGDDELKGQVLREGTVQQDKENEAEGNKAVCSEFVEKIVAEGEDELRF